MTKRRGISNHPTLVDVLRGALGGGYAPKSNGLAALAGKWTDEEFAEFERNVQELGEESVEIRSERSHVR